MINLYVRDIINKCNGKLICGDMDLVLGRVVTDTRVIEKGDVYFGLKGEKINGSDYYLDAIKRGASVCILNKEVNIDDTLKCLQKLAKYKRSLMDIPVVAITGSVGKTSTKDMISSVISSKYRVHKTSGNYNNHIGVPLTILEYIDQDVMVVEMGMNHLGEISLLSNIVKPTISVITNVGTAHIGNLGSRENILKAKLEILDGMVGKDIVINVDNDMLASVKDKLCNKYNVHTVSIDGDSDYKAINIREDVFNGKFDIKDKDRDILVNVGGKVFVYNSLVAYAVGDILDIDDDLKKDGIKNFKLSSHRLEKKISKSGIVIIDDTYNANYDSMKASIELLGKVKDKRRVFILGDMLELGDYSYKMHRDLGDIVYNNNIDLLVTIGDESIEVDNRVKELGMEVNHFKVESDCYKFLESNLNSNDIVLVKGSHGIHLVNVVNRIIEM